jgi:hypothetical protein
MALVSVLLMWFLLAWAYSRALLGTLARVMEIWRPRPPRRERGDVFESWWVQAMRGFTAPQGALQEKAHENFPIRL